MFGFLMIFVMTSRKMSDPNGHCDAITEIHNSSGKPKGTFCSDTSTGVNVFSAEWDSMLLNFEQVMILFCSKIKRFHDVVAKKRDSAYESSLVAQKATYTISSALERRFL